VRANGPRAAPRVLAVPITGSAMAFIDGTVVNVALPQIQAQLNATAVGAQRIVESYALFLAALILVVGFRTAMFVARDHGRRPETSREI
jgi:MFS family permease